MKEQCGRDQFQCGQGQCIPKSGLCDLKVDCVDGTDEVDSICGEWNFKNSFHLDWAPRFELKNARMCVFGI